MLADEAVMYDTNLGPYFSMHLGTAEEEHRLMDKGAAYDHFVFHFVKRFLRGPAALLAESLKGIGSGRALVIDLIRSFMTNFSGEVISLRERYFIHLALNLLNLPRKISHKRTNQINN